MKALKILATLVAILFSLSAQAAYVQTIDTFESGHLDLSKWDIDLGDAMHADVYNAISAFYDNGEGPKLYYPPEGSWMMVVSAGDPVTKLSTSFTAFSGGTLDMQVFFSAIEGYLPWIPGYNFNDFTKVRVDGSEIFFMDTASADPFGEGMGNTGWVSLSKPLAAGNHMLEILVENGGGDYYLDSQLAVDNIRVLYDFDTSPIPEASTWAMMVAGLGLVSLVVRRRRQGSAIG